MARMSSEQIAHAKRATERARDALKPGDVIQFTRCGGTKARAIFKGWDRDWICSATCNDIHALHIFKLNGEPVSFADPTDGASV